MLLKYLGTFSIMTNYATSTNKRRKVAVCPKRLIQLTLQQILNECPRPYIATGMDFAVECLAAPRGRWLERATLNCRPRGTAGSGVEAGTVLIEVGRSP